MKKYLQFILEKNEDFSGPVFVQDLNLTLKIRVNQKEDYTSIDLIIDDEVYDNLSVETPDSKNLDKNEFFINPEIDKKIVKELVSQNFIHETGVLSTFGDKSTKSYLVTFS